MAYFPFANQQQFSGNTMRPQGPMPAQAPQMQPRPMPQFGGGFGPRPMMPQAPVLPQQAPMAQPYGFNPGFRPAMPPQAYGAMRPQMQGNPPQMQGMPPQMQGMPPQMQGWRGQPNLGGWTPGAGMPPWANGGQGGVSPDAAAAAAAQAAAAQAAVRGWQNRPNVGTWTPGAGMPPWAQAVGQRLLQTPPASPPTPAQTVLNLPPQRTDVVFPHEQGS